MATFLTTSKMSPELAARVERSVSGKSNKTVNTFASRRVIAIARVAVVVALVVGIYVVLKGRQQEHVAFLQSRASLISTVETESASLTAYDKEAVTRAESLIVPFASLPNEPDLVAEELRKPNALATMLGSHPSLYVRGPIDSFKSSMTIADAAATSTKDSLVLCLLEPPTARTEKVLLEKVRVAYLAGAPMEQRTPNVHRLSDAIVGLPFLRSELLDRARKAEDTIELGRVRREIEHTPFDRTKAAVRSELLLMAFDEPSDGKGPTELDGERPHTIRLGLVDLTTTKLLLRVRLPVDPSWISVSKRPTYANGLDACAFAFDVHARTTTIEK